MMEPGGLAALAHEAEPAPSGERAGGASATRPKLRAATAVATVVCGMLLLGFVDGAFDTPNTSDVISAAPASLGESLPADEVDAPEPQPVPAPPAKKEGAKAAPPTAPDKDPTPNSARPSKRLAPRRAVGASSRQPVPTAFRQADRPRPVEPKKEKKRKWYDPRKWF